MFWIGLIVGVIIAILLVVAYVAWSYKTLGFTSQEYWDICELIVEACDNRECELQVVKDDTYLNGVVLEEH